MNIKVNGNTRFIDPAALNQPNLKNVIKQLGHEPDLVVVELNGRIVTPTYWENQEIKDGDNMEIVTIVGGGN